MTPDDLPFTVEEYHARLHRTRAAMEQHNLDTLIVSDPSNMAWLTGYDGWSFYVHQGVIITQDQPPIWWGRNMDGFGALRTVWMPPEQIVTYDDSYVQNPQKHPMRNLARMLQDRQVSTARIGVELDNYYYSAAAHQALTTALPSAELIDATGLVNWQRAVKSDTEISYMRRAAGIVERMHEVIREKAVPGLPKNKLIADIYHAAIEGTEEAWGDYPAIVPMAPSGANATAPHLTWDGAPLREGETTFFEIAGVYRRYHCPQSRTIFLGTPPQKYRDAEKAVLEATEAALEQARPGQTCADIANAFNARLNTLGFEKDSRCGYSIGLSYPPDWGERTMSLRKDDQTELRPGMCFHFMPALWLDDGGLEITEPILITDSGHQRLCRTAARLEVKG